MLHATWHMPNVQCGLSFHILFYQRVKGAFVRKCLHYEYWREHLTKNTIKSEHQKRYESPRKGNKKRQAARILSHIQNIRYVIHKHCPRQQRKKKTPPDGKILMINLLFNVLWIRKHVRLSTHDAAQTRKSIQFFRHFCFILRSFDYFLGLDSRLIVVIRFYAIYLMIVIVAFAFAFRRSRVCWVYMFWFVLFFFFLFLSFFPILHFFRCFSFSCWLLFRFIYLLFSLFFVLGLCVCIRVLLSPRVVFNIVPFSLIVTKLFFLSFGFFFLSLPFSKIGIKCVYVLVNKLCMRPCRTTGSVIIERRAMSFNP